MEAGDQDEIWYFDAVAGFLKSPEWACPVWWFIDDNCVVFDSEDENKMVYTEIHNSFKEMCEGLLELHLTDFGIDLVKFVELCEQHVDNEYGKEAMEQILAVDDFVSFKALMVKRNMELELESLKALQKLSSEIDGGEEPPPEQDQDEDPYAAELEEALRQSMIESKEAGTFTDVTAEEIKEAREDREEADLAMAIALSLQIEEQEQINNKEIEPPAAPAPVAAPHRPAPAPVAKPAASKPLPSKPLPPVASLMPSHAQLPEIKTIQRQKQFVDKEWAPEQVEAAKRAEQAQNDAKEARERALAVAREKEQQQAAAGPRGPNADEMRARAEHLRKQRDLILAQRKKAMVTELAPDASAEAPPTTSAPPPGAHKPAGYQSDERASLTKSLAEKMKAQLIGDGGSSIDLKNRLDDRKADFDATMQSLRNQRG